MKEDKAKREENGEEDENGQGRDGSTWELRGTPRLGSRSNVGVSPSPAHQSAILEAREELPR